MAAQLIPLRTWAEAVFGEHRPHANTLLNWIKNGKIRPVPRKVGREYFCRPDAEYVDPVAERIERMIGGR
jgi:predicted site-specific integrase-resolvase